ncbi:hypothetical protein C8F04DRAFT_1191348 [Mycena alexandri]|uniref:Uncharacterized protein n=1 Tax=Mycena alexandri TaxID=1745969 RepID=A0AAD6WYC4_9AGAR|nr:hypothetical protein C8F04DRAFT_1191348 [Mycena alexandri]
MSNFQRGENTCLLILGDSLCKHRVGTLLKPRELHAEACTYVAVRVFSACVEVKSELDSPAAVLFVRNGVGTRAAGHCGQCRFLSNLKRREYLARHLAVIYIFCARAASFNGALHLLGIQELQGMWRGSKNSTSSSCVEHCFTISARRGFSVEDLLGGEQTWLQDSGVRDGNDPIKFYWTQLSNEKYKTLVNCKGGSLLSKEKQ